MFPSVWWSGFLLPSRILVRPGFGCLLDPVAGETSKLSELRLSKKKSSFSHWEFWCVLYLNLNFGDVFRSKESPNMEVLLFRHPFLTSVISLSFFFISHSLSSSPSSFFFFPPSFFFPMFLPSLLHFFVWLIFKGCSYLQGSRGLLWLQEPFVTISVVSSSSTPSLFPRPPGPEPTKCPGWTSVEGSSREFIWSVSDPF